MVSSEFSVDGLKELNAHLQDLPAKIERNILRAAVGASARFFRDKAKERVPVDTGALRNDFKVSTKAKGGVATATLTVGSNTFYAHFIEYGTASYYSGPGKRSKRRPYTIQNVARSGGRSKNALRFEANGSTVYSEWARHPGVRPQPFMRPAFDNYNQEAITAFADYVRKRLAKEAAKT